MLRPPIFAISILAIAAWNFLFKQRSNHAQFKNVVKRDLYSKFAPFNCLVKSFSMCQLFCYITGLQFSFFSPQILILFLIPTRFMDDTHLGEVFVLNEFLINSRVHQRNQTKHNNVHVLILKKKIAQ